MRALRPFGFGSRRDSAAVGASSRTRRPIAVSRRLPVAIIAASCFAVASCSTPHEPTPTPTRTLAPYPQFAADNVYDVDVTRAPVDPDSAAMVKGLAAQVADHWGGVAAFNHAEYNTVIHRVDSTTPRTKVEFNDCQRKGEVPPGLHDGPAYFDDVPVPSTATTTTGTDSTMSIWSPETDQLWEFWVMDKRSDGRWQACWGGRIDEVSKSRGQFEPPYGVSASGLTMVGTTVRIPEARAGRIDHAIGLGLIDVKAGEFRYPATRSDGAHTAPHAIPEGTRLRLDPAVDVDTLGLTPLGAAVARAAQKYGFIVVDRSGAVGIGGESSAPWVARGEPDPWTEILGDTPNYAQLKGFPWERLQVIDPGFASPAGSQTG